MAVRLAIGASRRSLIRQLLVENLLLAAAAGVASLLVGYGIVALFRAMPPRPSDLPMAIDFAWMTGQYFSRRRSRLSARSSRSGTGTAGNPS